MTDLGATQSHLLHPRLKLCSLNFLPQGPKSFFFPLMQRTLCVVAGEGGHADGWSPAGGSNTWGTYTTNTMPDAGDIRESESGVVLASIQLTVHKGKQTSNLPAWINPNRVKCDEEQAQDVMVAATGGQREGTNTGY